MNYTLDGKNTASNIENEKDMGVIIDSRFLFREHIARKTKIVKSMIAVIKKKFLILTEEIMVKLYKTLARPHLENANQSRSPFLKEDKLAFENVQRKTTRLIPSLCNLACQERLKKFGAVGPGVQMKI